MAITIVPTLADVRALIPKYCPHYHLVPTDYRKNLKWRRELLRAGASDPNTAAELWQMCKDDVLFYVSSFCFTFQIKDNVRQAVQPFVPYPFQEEVMLDMKIAGWFGEHRAYEKSRDLGLSWMAIYDADHDWRFFDNQSILFGSRKEEYVDKKGDMKSLFAKLDFIEKWLPPFLQVPDRDRKTLHLGNPRTESVISGESTNENFARGDRRSKIIPDEFAFSPDGNSIAMAMMDASASIRAISTHNHPNTAFNQSFVRNPEIVTRRIHWSMHPLKAKGLYRWPKEGPLEILSEGYRYPTDFKFIRDGKIRSPWYDRECRRRKHRIMVARELDIDPGGSSFRFFEDEMVRMAARRCIEAASLGMVEDGRWQEMATGGLVRWWVPLAKDGHLSGTGRRIVVGADLSMGTGASNSSASFGDAGLRMKIGAFVTPHFSPEKFADAVHEICNWLRAAGHSVRHKWESNGPGRIYGKRLIELGEKDFFLKTNEKTLSQKQSQIPGWSNEIESKYALLDNYREALADGWFDNPDADAVEELTQYIQIETGAIVHAETIDAIDPSGAGSAHGDRVISDALMLSEFGRPVTVRSVERIRGIEPGLEEFYKTYHVPNDAPVNCLARRIAKDRANGNERWELIN